MWDNPVTYLVALGAVGALVKAGMWIGSMNEHKSTVVDFMADIRKDLRQLRLDVGKLLGKPVPIKTDSPLALTDYGKELSEKLDAVNWAKMEAVSLRSQDTGTEPFEIEEFSFEYVRKEYPTVRDLARSLRAAIYEHGLDRDHVYDVLALELRDELIRRSEGSTTV